MNDDDDDSAKSDGGPGSVWMDDDENMGHGIGCDYDHCWCVAVVPLDQVGWCEVVVVVVVAMDQTAVNATSYPDSHGGTEDNDTMDSSDNDNTTTRVMMTMMTMMM